MAQTQKALFKVVAVGSAQKNGPEVKVMFNPEKVAIKKQVDWEEQKRDYHNSPTYQFKSGKSRTMDLTLLFDTTGDPQGPGDAPDVRDNISALEAMAVTDNEGKKHQPPPTVMFQWGSGLQMTGVFKSINVTYTKFRPDGIPVRAEVQVSLTEVNPGDAK